jgi:hypothetical protein
MRHATAERQFHSSQDVASAHSWQPAVVCCSWWALCCRSSPYSSCSGLQQVAAASAAAADVSGAIHVSLLLRVGGVWEGLSGPLLMECATSTQCCAYDKNVVAGWGVYVVLVVVVRRQICASGGWWLWLLPEIGRGLWWWQRDLLPVHHAPARTEYCVRTCQTILV